MKKILLVLISVVAFVQAADTLCYWKATENSLWRTDANWNPKAPITANLIAVLNGDSSNFNDTLKTTTTTCGQLQLINYSGALTNTSNLNITPSSNKYAILISGVDYTWNGNGQVLIQPGAGTIDTLSAITYTGTGIWSIQTSGGTGQTTSLAGNLTLGTATLNIFKNSTGQQTFNGSGFNVKCGTFQIGNANATNSVTVNFGSGSYDFNIYGASTQTGNQNVNWNSATINVAGNFTHGSNQTTGAGTSRIVFDSSTNTILSGLSRTRKFYDFEIAKTGAVKCSTATATDTIDCHEFRVTTGRAAIIAPLYCDSYLNLSTDTSRMFNDKTINTSFYRASTANAIADTFKTYFITNVNHDISCDTNITLGRFIISEGRVTALTNLRLVKFALPVASKLTITAGKIVRIDSTYDLEGTAGNLDSIVSGTAGVAAKLWLPANDTFSYAYVKDINSTDTIYLDSTCVNGGGNTNVFDVSYCTGPTVTTHPSSTSALAPATASFSVAATGDAPLSYQWQKSSVNIAGATASSYTTPATSTADNGATFRAIASNSCGADTSDEATLTVGCNPSVSVTPSKGDTAGGTSVAFYVPYCGGLTGSTSSSVDSYTVTSDSTATGTTKANAKGTVQFEVVLTGGDTLRVPFRYTAGGQLSSRQKAFQSLRTNAYITP